LNLENNKKGASPLKPPGFIAVELPLNFVFVVMCLLPKEGEIKGITSLGCSSCIPAEPYPS